MFANQFEPFFVSAYILIFIVLWMGFCKPISVFGGWQALSRDYRANSPFDGRKLWLKSVGMRRWINYNNCIILGVNKFGLYIAVLPILRIGHPPLLIPWTDISTEAVTRRLLPDLVKFKFTKQPDVPMVFSKKLAERIFKMRQDSQQGFSASSENYRV